LSYLDEMERILGEHETRLGCQTVHCVEFVRVGSFQVKVTVIDPHPKSFGIFDLKAGFTPGTQRAIKEWYEPILARTKAPGSEAPESAAALLPEDNEQAQAISAVKPIQQVQTSGGFMAALRKFVPAHQRT
jgi:hypothetical protein